MAIDSSNSQFYQLGGTLEVNAPSYVQRQADEDFYQGLWAGEFCYVLNSRQMGKSSLQTRTKQRLEAEGICCAIVDITEIGTTDSTPVEWYAGIVFTLMNGFGLALDFDDWWESLPLLSPVQRFSQFLEAVLLRSISGPIVIFVDEIDSVRSLPFDADDFFAVIRSFYNQRSAKPDYWRLTFALLGAATPVDLIRDMQRTPFNVGRAIELSGFRLDEAGPLAEGLEVAGGAIAAILDWTGGQPFLTQKVCELVRQAGAPQGDLKMWVAGIVRKGITESWEGKDDPVHLRTIQGRVLEVGEAQQGRLLGLYQQVLGQEDGLVGNDSMEQIQLRLSGLVAKRDGRLQVFNRIYREVFDRAWVDGELAKLRPAYYGVAISEWLVTGDESRLLRGEALRDAIAWSQGKQLSDDDSRFLRLSQEAENRVEKEANRRLTEVNRQVRRRASIGGVVLAGSLVLAGTSAIVARNQVKLAKTKIQAVGIQVDAAKAQAEGFAGRQLLGLVQGIRVEGRYKQLSAQVQGSDAAAQPELIEAKLQTQAVLTNVFGIHERNSLKGHQGRIWSVNFSPDGQTIVSGGSDGILKLWNHDGTEQMTTQGHQGVIWSVNFSPDGQTIVSGGSDGTLKLWNYDGTKQMTIQGHQGSVWSVNFSPDGKTIVSGGEDSMVKLWNLNGTERATLKGHNGRVKSVNFSPDGQTIVSGGKDGTVKLWNLNGTERAALKGHKGWVMSVNFSPNGQTIVSGSEDGTVKLWNLDGTERVTLKGHKGWVMSVNFSPDGQTIVSGGSDSTVKLWNRDNIGSDSTVKLWNRDNIAPTTLYDCVRSTNSSPDRLTNGCIRSINFSPDRLTIVSGDEDSTVKLWALDGTERATLKGHKGSVLSVNFSPDGQTIVSGGKDGKVKLWNLNGTKRATLKGHNDSVMSVNFSPDGQTIVSGGEDGTVKLWNLDGTIEKMFYGNQDWVMSVNFSPDGQTIVSGGKDGTVKLWSLNSSERTTLPGHIGSVMSVNFSPDGQTIVSGSEDGTVKLWTLDGTERATLKGHNGSVLSVNFSPDGKTIVSGGEDGTVKLAAWDLARLLKLSCDWARDYLRSSPDVSDDDRAICGIPARAKKIEN
jgi:WD40 repeat protein